MLALFLAFAKSAAESSNPTIKQTDQQNAYFDAIKKPACDPVLSKSQDPSDCFYQITKAKNVGSHQLANQQKPPSDLLRQYLESKHSPLANYTQELLASDYWAAIIAISNAEESFYIQPAASPYNLWGVMYPRCCILKKFASFPESIAYMDQYLGHWDAKGYSTVESLNGVYVYPWSASWQATVIATMTEVENYH